MDEFILNIYNSILFVFFTYMIMAGIREASKVDAARQSKFWGSGIGILFHMAIFIVANIIARGGL